MQHKSPICVDAFPFEVCSGQRLQLAASGSRGQRCAELEHWNKFIPRPVHELEQVHSLDEHRVAGLSGAILFQICLANTFKLSIRGDAMYALRRYTVVLTVIGLLAGCAMPSAIVPNATTADELLKKLGQPTDKRPNPQGGEFWEYAYGPEGTETWLFGVDQGRMVRSSAQLLTEERLQQVVAGKSTEADVLALLGKPREIVRLRGEIVWEWRVRIGPEYGIYVVRFGPDKRALGYNVLRDLRSDGDRGDGGR
jgi:hypothetical protein